MKRKEHDVTADDESVTQKRKYVPEAGVPEAGVPDELPHTDPSDPFGDTSDPFGYIETKQGAEEVHQELLKCIQTSTEDTWQCLQEHRVPPSYQAMQDLFYMDHTGSRDAEIRQLWTELRVTTEAEFKIVFQCYVDLHLHFPWINLPTHLHPMMNITQHWRDPHWAIPLRQFHGMKLFPLEQFGLDSRLFASDPRLRGLYRHIHHRDSTSVEYSVGGSIMTCIMQAHLHSDVTWTAGDIDVWITSPKFTLTSWIEDFAARLHAESYYGTRLCNIRYRNMIVQCLFESQAYAHPVLCHDMECVMMYMDLNTNKVYATVGAMVSNLTRTIHMVQDTMREDRIQKYQARGFSFHVLPRHVVPPKVIVYTTTFDDLPNRNVGDYFGLAAPSKEWRFSKKLEPKSIQAWDAADLFPVISKLPVYVGFPGILYRGLTPVTLRMPAGTIRGVRTDAYPANWIRAYISIDNAEDDSCWSGQKEHIFRNIHGDHSKTFKHFGIRKCQFDTAALPTWGIHPIHWPNTSEHVPGILNASLSKFDEMVIQFYHDKCVAVHVVWSKQ